MRLLTYLILTFFFINGLYSQEKLLDIFPLKDQKVTYTNIVHVDSITKDELYKRARKWLAYTCETVKIDYKYELIGSGYISDGVWYIIAIQMKEGRYKYEITNFIVKYLGSSTNFIIPLEEDYRNKTIAYYWDIDRTIKAMITSLKKAMQTPIYDNW